VVIGFAGRTVRRDMLRVETVAAGQRSMGLP
jgi:hypothetical protein